MDGFHGAIISIGTQTDSVLDRFDLGDSIVPRLRVLMQTVRSGRWEAILRSSQFGLSYEQASKLTDAMMKDLGGMRNTTSEVRFKFSQHLFLTLSFIQSSSTSCGLVILTIILSTIIAALAAFIFT